MNLSQHNLNEYFLFVSGQKILQNANKNSIFQIIHLIFFMNVKKMSNYFFRNAQKLFKIIFLQIRVSVGTNGIATQDNADFFYIDKWSSQWTWGGLSPPEEGDFVVIQKVKTFFVMCHFSVIKNLFVLPYMQTQCLTFIRSKIVLVLFQECRNILCPQMQKWYVIMLSIFIILWWLRAASRVESHLPNYSNY